MITPVAPPAESADLKLFKAQERIYPKRASGFFRNLKWMAMAVCLAIYYGVPFIRWNRGPNAPDQAVLIDLERGRAYWFWIEIWPQEVYILTGLLVLAAIGLFFITSLLGRVWCGYLCFQTVWTDLFILVEHTVQGDRNARKKLHDGPWTFEKIWKLTVTHAGWLAIAWCTAGSFVLYFNDAPTLVNSFFEFTVSPVVLMFIGGLTFSTYLMAGFAREQVCTYMCPYARFQSAMFDKDTLIIGYDTQRGEPRGKLEKLASGGIRTFGDCIDCSACVQVCPTGIDIRNGLQMECIACGLCIDACDHVMDKIDRPRGLIRYDSERVLESRESITSYRFIRPRTLYYLCVLAVVAALIVTALVMRAPFDMTVLHDRNPLFVRMADGSFRNGYEIKILNKTHHDTFFELTVDGVERPRLSVQTADGSTHERLFVPADAVAHFHVLLVAAGPAGDPQRATFTLTEKSSGDQVTYDSVFITERSNP